jgi:hypothetical protein
VFTDVVDGPLIDAVAAALGRPRVLVSTANRSNAASKAMALYGLLGAHLGHREKPSHLRTWRTWRERPVTQRLIERHLGGQIDVCPFHPHGAWPFVVIDVDRHNAIQAQAFADTMKALRREFPDGIVLQSSASGGRHIYLRLPEGTTYEEAALLVRFHLAEQGLLWLERGGERPVRSIRVEVPVEPPRLPFGAGSGFPGDARPIDTQVTDFCHRLGSLNTNDFDRVRAAVRLALGKSLAGKWSVVKVRRLEKQLLRAEVANLSGATFDAPDPIATVATKLPAHLQKVLAHGIPAYGTRTRWTLEMARHLGMLTSPAEAADTIERWLRRPGHVSADLEDAPERVIDEARRMAKLEAKANGVPTRIWARVARLVRLVHADIQDPIRRGALERRRNRKFSSPQHITIDALRQTAFQILRAFCHGSRGYRRCRAISVRQFAAYSGKNLAHDVEMALTDNGHGGWLTMIRGAATGRSSRLYRLEDCAWPMRPHEPRVYEP